jgi:hypothetical protein
LDEVNSNSEKYLQFVFSVPAGVDPEAAEGKAVRGPPAGHEELQKGVGNPDHPVSGIVN